MQKQLIEYFPMILNEAPDFIYCLEKYNGWKKSKKPSEVLRDWESEPRSNQFYFIGWLEEATKHFGVAGMIVHFSLHQKLAISEYIVSILEEASHEDIENFKRGVKERYSK